MPRIEVEPGQLQTASGRQTALAEQVAGLCGALEAAGNTAAGAAGEPVAAAAMADCAGAWSASLRMFSMSVAGLANNLGAAGSAYELTDTTAIPVAPR
jgi:Excreted virulence factor EspC, type VII ESX diderm